MIAVAFFAWIFIGFALFSVWGRATRVDPGLVPRGGFATIIAAAFAWPLVLVLVLLALLMRGINEVL